MAGCGQNLKKRKIIIRLQFPPPKQVGGGRVKLQMLMYAIPPDIEGSRQAGNPSFSVLKDETFTEFQMTWIETLSTA